MTLAKPDLDTALLEDLEQRAVRIARGAGEILLDHFRKPLEIEYKSANRQDPVTNADRLSEEYLRSAISTAFPDHGIVGEEREDADQSRPDFVWVLDPLDGTTNYLNGLPIFAVSIGLLYRGAPVVGALFLPSVDRADGSVFHARIGGGAFQDDHPLSVVVNPQPERGYLTGLPSYYWRLYGLKGDLRRRLGEVRHLGSIAYEMALTARGGIQYSVFNAPRVWDVAAGVLIVAEAGGSIWTKTKLSQPWRPFQTFTEGGHSTLESIRAWRAPIVAGNADLGDYVTKRLSNRRLYWRRLRRWIGLRFQRRSS